MRAVSVQRLQNPTEKKIISANGRTGSNRLKAVEESSSKKAVNGDLSFQTCCILSFIWDDKRLSYFSQKSLTLSCLQTGCRDTFAAMCCYHECATCLDNTPGKEGGQEPG